MQIADHIIVIGQMIDHEHPDQRDERTRDDRNVHPEEHAQLDDADRDTHGTEYRQVTLDHVERTVRTQVNEKYEERNRADPQQEAQSADHDTLDNGQNIGIIGLL